MYTHSLSCLSKLWHLSNYVEYRAWTGDQSCFRENTLMFQFRVRGLMVGTILGFTRLFSKLPWYHVFLAFNKPLLLHEANHVSPLQEATYPQPKKLPSFYPYKPSSLFFLSSTNPQSTQLLSTYLQTLPPSKCVSSLPQPPYSSW
jgi:hypothetical protein